MIEASEAEDALAARARALAFDPARLEEAETRLFELRALARKHRVEPDALPALRESLRASSSAIEAGGAGIAALTPRRSRPRRRYDRRPRRAERGAGGGRAAARRGGRRRARPAQARRRALPHRDRAPAEPGASGRDRVEFEVSTNPGAPFGPLIRIASGGELSRFILALKVALAEQGGATTMIFDEIDRGVGGAVASAVGERLTGSRRPGRCWSSPIRPRSRRAAPPTC